MARQRRKILISLIADRRVRDKTFAKRKEGVRKKAWELATLCGVPVALVFASPVGSAMATELWESEEGVLDRYCALLPEARSQHTHRRYLEGELGKERAKIAKIRQDGALEPWDNALNDITPREAQSLLKSIDAALRATSARMRALGLLDGEDGRLVLHVPSLVASNAVVPFGNSSQYIGIGGSGSGSNQLQMIIPAGYGGNRDHCGLLSWEDDTFQPCNADAVQPGYGFQCPGGGYLHMDGGYQVQALCGASVHDGMSDHSMWCADELGNFAVMPARYPPTQYTGHDGSFIAAQAEHIALSTGADFINAPNDYLSMAIGGNSINIGDYSTQCPVAYGFQRGDANQLDQPQYLDDLADGMGAESGHADTQLQNLGNGSHHQVRHDLQSSYICKT
ncbi:hypothetical protein GUJ93_ZPchr0001g32223 [Zizania palustris]|uniref:MADS-box domain-containing protein n=1 Tax=Zizania palustris TaxID=103762 RepID=A0A8J5RND2_ZIZPA|nr:hypothetical protein GUJ93_ZPchr0001g32223 [Zizania palustris]